MSWRDGDFDPHGGRNAFRCADDNKQSSSERAASMRAIRSFTQSIEDDIGPPELPPSLDIDIIEGSSMKTSDTNDTIIEVKQKVDPQLGETQKYKMAVPGPGHSEQEQELHKSLIRDDEEDAEIEQAFANAPPKTLNFQKSNERDPTTEELRRAYDQKPRKRPTTPTSSCVLDGIAFFASSGDTIEQTENLTDAEKIKVSIPSRRRKTDMSYTEFYESMANQMPNQGRRTSGSGRTTPLNDYEGDIIDENPYFKDKAPPVPVIHRRSSIEWENFADMEEKMEQAEKKIAKEEEESRLKETAREVEQKNPKLEEDRGKDSGKTDVDRNSKANKKLAFYAKPPTVEITSPDAPHHGTFHDSDMKTEKVAEEPEKEKEAEQEMVSAPVPNAAVPATAQEEEDEDVPTFSEDMDEERQKYQCEGQQPSSDEKTEENQQQNDAVVHDGNHVDEVQHAQEQAAEDYDPNAYPGYIWNYDTQQWEYDPNYVPPEDAYEQIQFEAAYDASAAHDPALYNAGYDQPEHDQNQATAYNYDQTAYQTEAYTTDTTSAEASADPAQEYDYSAYGGYEGYLAACKAYEEQNAQYAQTQEGYVDQQAQGYYDQNGQVVGSENAYAGYGDSYQGYGDQYGGYDYNQTEQTDYDYSQYQQYQQGTYEPDQTTYEQPQEYAANHEAPAPVVSEPLFKVAPTVDPYAWDAAEATPTHSTTQVQEETKEVVRQESENHEHAKPPARPPPARPEAPKHGEETAPPRPPPVARPPPPRPAPAKKEEKPKEPEPEEDAWAQFKKMTEKVNNVVKNTESTLKTLEETSAANDIKDESYFAQIGGSQGFVNDATQREIQRLNDEKKQEKLQKKKLKHHGKKAASPEMDPDQEDAMDRAAQELAMKLAHMRTDIGDWKAPELPKKEEKQPADLERQDSLSAIPPRKRSSIKDVQQDSGGSLELPPHLATQQQDSVTPKGDLAPDDPILSAPAWADFETSDPILPPSESGFFSNKDASNEGAAVSSDASDPFSKPATVTKNPSNSVDPFAPQQTALIDESYDPFAVVAVEEVVAMAKAKAEQAAANAEHDDDFYNGRQSPTLSTPTPEGGSPISQRPNQFEDDFKCDTTGLDTPTPLYDEDDSQPLTDFLPKFSGDGWNLMVRHPIKKKSFMAERCWKPCFVRLHGMTLLVYNDVKDSSPIQELLLQATYSLSDTTLQAYDVFGKIHTVKLQFVVYKEKVGIRQGQISRLVDGHITKFGLPLEHSAQCTVLLKFGSLEAAELQSFVNTIEDILFKCQISRTTKPIYKQDEVQIHCYDEYSAFVDKEGALSDQKARVRLFCLAFLSGAPFLEIGLNDRRRQGKEIVRRKDILPMYTERWIRFEALEFHSMVNKDVFDKEQVITFSPPDGCFFEIMRFRIRPPRNREKAMTVKSIMKIAGSKVEIRIEAMAAAQIQRTRGSDERRTIPCEDITIRFPIPEAWIYLFREERHWGVGSIHSKKLRPGKVKNLKDRLLGAVQTSEANLIECAIGEAKYEHVYRALVWRIPRLPEKHHAAYKSHLLKCRFELSSFDLMPEEFLPRCDVDFTMPLATVSNTVVRSVSIEQHEDSDRVEKFVRYVAKYQYKVEIDYIQCANLDLDMADPSVNPEAASAPVPELHQPAFNADQNADAQQGYRIDFNESEMGITQRQDDSSSDDEPDSHKMPIIQIDMKNYGY